VRIIYANPPLIHGIIHRAEALSLLTRRLSFFFIFLVPLPLLVIITKLEYLILKSSIPRQYISNNTAVKSDKLPYMLGRDVWWRLVFGETFIITMPIQGK